MKKRTVHGKLPLPSNQQSPEIPEPGKCPLDLPSPRIPPKLPPILCLRFDPILPVWTDQLDSSLLQPKAQRITIVGSIGDHTSWLLARTTPSWSSNCDLLKGYFQQRYFRRRGRLKVNSQRYTLAVDHHHRLRTLASLGRADGGAPFFAEAKLPSANVSCQSSHPRASSVRRNARQISSQTPCSSHWFRRLQQVEGLG